MKTKYSFFHQYVATGTTELDTLWAISHRDILVDRITSICTTEERNDLESIIDHIIEDIVEHVT